MRLAHIKTHPWIIPRKISHRLRQCMKTECRGAADAKFSLVSAFQIVGQGADPALGKDDGVGLFEDAFAKRCRHDALSRADHQFKPQPAFHQFHVAGQSRLRQPKRGRRSGEGTSADDFVELQQVTRIDLAHATPYQM